MVDATQMGARASVLLVEDELLISNVAAEALEEQGFAVETVSNANDALLRIRTGSPVDILFTDVNLAGGMDGATLARRVRELRPDLPVIYTSGRQSAIQGLDPVDGAMFVPKPYDLFNLGRLLRVSHRGQANARRRVCMRPRPCYPSIPPLARNSSSQWM